MKESKTNTDSNTNEKQEQFIHYQPVVTTTINHNEDDEIINSFLEPGDQEERSPLVVKKNSELKMDVETSSEDEENIEPTNMEKATFLLLFLPCQHLREKEIRTFGMEY